MRKLTVTALAAVVIGSSVACSVATSPDEVAVVYNKGPIAATEWQEQVNPGQRGWVDPFDESFSYPAGQRTYVFSDGTDAADRESLDVADKDGIQLGVPGQLRFALNTDTEVLKQFHEKIGLKYGKDDGAWGQILNVYLQQPLNRAVTEATQGFTWRDLYQDPAKKAAWENKAKELLPDFIQQAAGGEYFTGIDLTLQKPVLPPELLKSLLGAQTAEQELNRQKAENEVTAQRAIGERALVDLYGADNYALLKAIESGKVTFMQLPANGNVSIAPTGR